MQQKRSAICLLALLVSSYLCTLKAPGVESPTSAVRLAIIPGTPDTMPAADLLTVRLSATPHLQLLERAEIQKVFEEQGAVANQDYVKLGHLLGADGLLILTLVREGPLQSLQCKLVAAKPGVVVGTARSPWPMDDLDEWAARIPAQFEPLWTKLTVLAKDALPLSVLNLRSALKTSEAQALEKEVTLLLIHRLARERELFVLERQHMREVVFEQKLRPEPESPFWTGRYLLDGTLDREGYRPDQVTLSARLVSPQGGSSTVIEVVAPRNDPRTLVESLTTRLLAALQRTTSASEWRPADEAEQYFEEAKWAYRWKMLPEAQAASESAWALGKRSRELAALRIQAYSDSSMSGEFFIGNQEVDLLPDPRRIALARRAAELFCSEQEFGFTNGAAPDCEWYKLGLITLSAATNLLHGYYQMAEMRPGNESQLADLRGWTRRLATELATNSATRCTLNLNGCTLDGLEWEQGGKWCEHPEESLPAFRRVLEAGYSPKRLPGMAGWSWEDRKRIPKLMSRFLDECCASTNSRVRLEGLYLYLLWRPFDSQAHEQKLLADLWEQRQLLWSDRGACSLLERTEAAMLDSRGYTLKVRLEEKRFLDLKRDLRIGFLQEPHRWNIEVFRDLFPVPVNQTWEVSPSDDDAPGHPTPPAYSLSERVALVPLLKRFSQNFNSGSGDDRQASAEIQAIARRLENSLASANPVAATPAAPPVSDPAAVPGFSPALRVQFSPWRLKKPGIGPDKPHSMSDVRVRNGKVWFRIRYSRWDIESAPTCYVAIAPPSTVCEEIFLPEEFGYPEGSYEVTDDSLFVSVAKRLARYRFKERTWESISVPVEAGVTIIGLRGHLYLASAESLLEFSPDSRETQVLASSRRRPAINELDSAWDPHPQIGATRHGLAVWAERELFEFAPDQRVFTRQSALPKGHEVFRTVPFFSDQGTELFYQAEDRDHECHRLLAFWDGSTETNCLLEHLVPFPKGHRYRPLQLACPPPQWDWPTGYPLDVSCILAEGKSLWALVPRKPTRQWSQTCEPVAFSDDRQATLLHFEPAQRQAQAAPLRFEKDGQPLDPFASESHDEVGQFRCYALQPLWANTSEGFIVACQKMEGHWFVSKQSFTAASRPLSARSGSESTVNASTNGVLNPAPGAAPPRARLASPSEVPGS